MAKELILYLPVVLQDIAEYQALSIAESPFTADIEEKTNQLVDNSFLSTMSVERLAEWENALGIIPSTNSLTQRRSVVLSRFRGTGKLNKTLIQAMVNAFTGGSASVEFADGLLTVEVAPPSSTFVDFSVDTLNGELLKRKPAHLLLNVKLAYITWGQVKNTLTSWGNIATNFKDWNEVYLYYTNEEVQSLWH